MSLKTYRDNNDFVRTHHVKTKDYRFDILKPYSDYEYVDIWQGPMWIGKPYMSKSNVIYTTNGVNRTVFEST